jgi:preprotein translocase subunit SecA
VRTQVLAQPLGHLRREDLDALAADLGRVQVDAWSDRSLNDLADADRQAILAHLQALEWFLDRNRLAKLQTQTVRDLEADVRQGVVDTLRRYQLERLQAQRLTELDREQRRMVHQSLQQKGLMLEESQMRPFQRQLLVELAPDVYRALLQDIGEQVTADWHAIRFQNLDERQQALLSAYLGRRIMGRIERRVLLHTISRLWIDYLTDIEDLRRGIGLEAYGQRDPLVEYKRRAFELFEELGDNIRRTVARSMFRQPPEPLRSQ